MRNKGTGRGVITNDGCAVELYALVPAGREPRVVHDAVPSGAAILELGCGAGRVTHRLLDLGHPVTAVDESPDMLARVRGAQTVESTIEALRLERGFPVVLLGSNLLHVGLPMLRTCRAHLAPGGQVLVEWHPPEWFDQVTDTDWAGAPVASRLRGVSRVGDLLSATAEYRAGDDVWTHAFTTRRLTDEQLLALLAEADLALDRWLTADRHWFSAVAATAAGPPASR